MQWLADYSLFLAQAATVIFLLALPIVIAVSAGRRRGGSAGSTGTLRVEDLGSRYKSLKKELAVPGDSKSGKKSGKSGGKAKKKEKAKKNDDGEQEQPCVYVLDFAGDIEASGSASLREEISAVLLGRREGDEVLLRLDSRGGAVSGYGLVSAQLQRLKKAGIGLTVSVDEVAASGGYLAACVADRILAAPFALIGSIGVLLQMPNLNRFLKKHHVDFEMLTAGDNKRHVTMFGEVTDEERKKAQQDLDHVHDAFLQLVQRQRPDIDAGKVGQGDAWLAEKALDMGLIDEIGTSDDWLLQRLETHRLLRLEWQPKRNLLRQLRQQA